jgi:hypothetical protein
LFGLLGLFAPMYLLLWIWGLLFAWGLLALRKRDARLAGLSLLTWAVQGAALVRVWLLGPWGTMGRGGR